MKRTTLLTKLTEYGEACKMVHFFWCSKDDTTAELREEVILLFEDIRAKELSLILDQKIEISVLKAKVNHLQQRCRK